MSNGDNLVEKPPKQPASISDAVDFSQQQNIPQPMAPTPPVQPSAGIPSPEASGMSQFDYKRVALFVGIILAVVGLLYYGVSALSAELYPTTISEGEGITLTEDTSLQIPVEGSEQDLEGLPSFYQTPGVSA